MVYMPQNDNQRKITLAGGGAHFIPTPLLRPSLLQHVILCIYRLGSATRNPALLGLSPSLRLCNSMEVCMRLGLGLVLVLAVVVIIVMKIVLHYGAKEIEKEKKRDSGR